MAALLARRRLSVSVAKSVDELAQSEQITEPAKIVGVAIGIDRRDRCCAGDDERGHADRFEVALRTSEKYLEAFHLITGRSSLTV